MFLSKRSYRMAPLSSKGVAIGGMMLLNLNNVSVHPL
jgi:hypothetical protein